MYFLVLLRIAHLCYRSKVIGDAQVVRGIQVVVDEKRIVGSWLAKQENPQAESPGIVWDAFYLYGPDAEWDAKPEPLIISGATVRDEADKLREKLVPLLTEKAP